VVHYFIQLTYFTPGESRGSDQRSGVCSAMVYSLPHGLHGGLRSAVQKILLAWVFRWHLVDLPPSRVFSAADAALSLGSAESGKSKECRGMCFSRIRSKGSRFTLGVWGLRCVRSMLRNPSQPQPSTGGRVRPVWPCPWRVLQKWSLLEVSSAA